MLLVWSIERDGRRVVGGRSCTAQFRSLVVGRPTIRHTVLITEHRRSLHRGDEGKVAISAGDAPATNVTHLCLGESSDLVVLDRACHFLVGFSNVEHAWLLSKEALPLWLQTLLRTSCLLSRIQAFLGPILQSHANLVECFDILVNSGLHEVWWTAVGPEIHYLSEEFRRVE